jgi:hypothetical protein
MKHESSLSHWGRVIAMTFGAAILLTSMLVARAYHAGEAALAESERAFDDGDLETATVAARESLTWYIPGAPHVEQAVGRLRAIAVGAEAAGDVANSLRAWEALRGGLFEVTHPWSRDSALFEEASAGVARLLLRQASDTASTTEQRGDLAQSLRQVYGAPSREPGHDWFALGTSVGMLMMLVFGARVLSTREFTSVTTMVVTRGGLLLGMGLWLLAAIGY